MSSYLFGRERRVADVPTDHPSCSKQHAVLQFRCGTAVGQRTLSRNATTAVLLLTNGGHQRNLPALPLCRLTEKEGADGMMHGSVRCAHQLLRAVVIAKLVPHCWCASLVVGRCTWRELPRVPLIQWLAAL